ncbi:dynein assembly factor with WDR repeat domains 1-like [Myxocyprinus asiaticus]|uniref:dynein assembly factor with WDR repeat domains 1-like n=1 Tax=Myxocyprinus asiaticus TaxID=70543 RepID=UPI002223D0D6|nr:dynein assembly factor with WDR repeat domains 1-like [Myxocyprinus asiaticus]
MALFFTSCTDVNELLSEIRAAEPLFTYTCVEQVKILIQKLQDKISQKEDRKFYLFKALQAHSLPLTNVAFNKSGSSFITGSYDRSCKIWDTASGEELHTLEGHRNVVYAIAFNNPYGATSLRLFLSLLTQRATGWSRVHLTTLPFCGTFLQAGPRGGIVTHLNPGGGGQI